MVSQHNDKPKIPGPKLGENRAKFGENRAKCRESRAKF